MNTTHSFACSRRTVGYFNRPNCAQSRLGKDLLSFQTAGRKYSSDILLFHEKNPLLSLPYLLLSKRRLRKAAVQRSTRDRYWKATTTLALEKINEIG